MGWTFSHATNYKANGTVDRKAECDNNYTWESDGMKVSVVKSRMVGTNYYAAIRCLDKETQRETIECVMNLTAGQDRHDPWFNFGYKSIPHTDDYECPMSIIKLLTEPEDEREANWRKKCEEYSKQPKLSDLPIGAVIKFANWNGNEYILTKMAPNYQFKRTWWYDAENNAYMPSRRITNFVVID